MIIIPLVLPRSQLPSPGTLGPVCPFSLSAPGPQSPSQSSKVSLTQAQARRVAWYRRKGASLHWNRTLAGPFPLQSLSFFIRDIGGTAPVTGAARTAVQKRALGHPCCPRFCRHPSPSASETSHPVSLPTPEPRRHCGWASCTLARVPEKSVPGQRGWLEPGPLGSQQAPGPPAPYLGRPPLIHAVGVLTAQSLLLRQAPRVCRGEEQKVISRVGPREGCAPGRGTQAPPGPQ